MRLLWSVLALGLHYTTALPDGSGTQDTAAVKVLLQQVEIIEQKTDHTTNTVQRWSGDAYESGRLVAEFKELYHEWNVGTIKIRETPTKMSEAESEKIKTPMGHLESKVETLMLAAVSKKHQMDTVGFTQRMVDLSQGLKDVVDKFNRAVIARVADKKAQHFQVVGNAMVRRVDRGIGALKFAMPSQQSQQSKPSASSWGQPAPSIIPQGRGPSGWGQAPDNQPPRPVSPDSSDNNPYSADGWDWSPIPTQAPQMPKPGSPLDITTIFVTSTIFAPYR
jgi:hypothetical protein